MVELEEVKVLGQPISNWKLLAHSTLRRRRQAKKSDACASVKKELHRSIKLNELKKGKAWESWWYLVINCNNWLLPATIYFAIFYCNILYCRLRNVLSLWSWDQLVFRSRQKNHLASWGETTTNSCRCINTAFPFFVRTVHQRENQVIHQTYLL